MAILTDFHTHSHFSGDCHTPMEEMIQKALALGMSHLCITEHMDPDYPQAEAADFNLDTLSYRREYLRLADKYKSRITLLWGVEIGIQPHILSEVTQYAASHPFDFIIASSHILYREDPYYASFFKNRDEDKVYQDYFREILHNIRNFSEFDVYGHLDYIVRYGPGKDARYSYDRYRDIFDDILKALIEKGKGLELNTGGIKYGLRELHPATDILKRYRSLGGEIITLGSDAHLSSDLLKGFDRAESLLKACGFSYYTIFQERKPQFIPL